MSKEHGDYQADKELRAEIKYPAEHLDEEYAKQSAERKAPLNDHANAELAANSNKLMYIAQGLYVARHDAGLTQEEVAKK